MRLIYILSCIIFGHSLGNAAPLGEEKGPRPDREVIKEAAKQFQNLFHQAALNYNKQTSMKKVEAALSRSKKLGFLKDNLKSFPKRKITWGKSGYYQISYPGTTIEFNSLSVTREVLFLNGKELSFKGKNFEDAMLEIKKELAPKTSFTFFIQNAHAKKGFEHHVLLSVLALNVELNKVSHPIFGTAWACETQLVECKWEKQVKENLDRLFSKIEDMANKCESGGADSAYEFAIFESFVENIQQDERSKRISLKKLEKHFYRAFQEFEEDPESKEPLLTCDRLVRMVDNLFQSSHSSYGNSGGHPLASGSSLSVASFEQDPKVKNKCANSYSKLENCLLKRSSSARNVFDQTERLPKETEAPRRPGQYMLDSEAFSN